MVKGLGNGLKLKLLKLFFELFYKKKLKSPMKIREGSIIL